MNIRFVTPPAAKQVGGIEHAVEGLREALQRHGTKVLQGGDTGDVEAVHHFHGLWDPSHSRLAARLHALGRPYVVSPHGMLEPWAIRHRRWKKLPYFWLIERPFLKRAQSLFVTSGMEAEHLALLLRHRRVEVLPLGCRDRRGPGFVAARETLGWLPNTRVILFLSRLDVKKGLDLLLQAMACDGQDWKGWRLVVVGDGEPSYVASLKALADRASARLPQVEWVGAVWGAARWPYLQGADLFCLPTHSENFGIAVLEALHVGTPVLTTDQTPWQAHRGLDGVFIAKPQILSLQKAISRARIRIADNWSLEDRRRLSTWAEQNFAWEKLAPMYATAYQSISKSEQSLNHPSNSCGATSSSFSKKCFGALSSVFSRVTTSGVFVANFDGLRFIAIALVVLFHAHEEAQHSLAGQVPLPGILSQVSVGWVGVTLFFAISGFVLALPFANHYLNGARRSTLSQYYLRRLTRLEPPYMICLLAYFGMKAFLLKQEGLFPHLLASMTYTHNLIYSDLSKINGVTWSLEVEVQFYLIAPLLAQIYRVSGPLLRRGLLVLGMVAMGVLTDWVLSPRGTSSSLYLLPHLNYFLVGFLLADVFATELAMGKDIRRSFFWDLLGTASWVAMFVAIHQFKVDSLMFPGLIFLAYLAAMRGVMWNAFTSNRVVFTIGGMCYTIYLWHNLVLEILVRKLQAANQMYLLLGPNWFWPAFLGVTSLFVLLVCSILFALIEKPFMFKTWPRDFATWVARFWSRPPDKALAVTGRPKTEDKTCC